MNAKLTLFTVIFSTTKVMNSLRLICNSVCMHMHVTFCFPIMQRFAQSSASGLVAKVTVLLAALEGSYRVHDTSQAIFGCSHSLRLRDEIWNDTEGREGRQTALGMFIGCSWAWLEENGPRLNAGSGCVSLHLCVCGSARMSGVYTGACVWERSYELLG